MNKGHRWSEEIRGIETDVEKLKVMLKELEAKNTATLADIDAVIKVLNKLFEERTPEVKK